jgi:hypothetical protein
MSDETSMLRLVHAAAKEEYEHITFWLEPRESHPFGEEGDTIGKKLRPLSGEAGQLLEKIDQDIQNGDVAAGWATYTELRTEVMPRLSNELLAIIGGMYLMTQNYDGLVPRDPRPVSFSKVARNLLKNLSQRADKVPGSILIVGEERVAPVQAEIIRLRFPACDVWNLPFTAHEYGYLIAQKDPPEAFRELKDDVRRWVDPREHQGRAGRDDDDCFLPEVHAFWERFGRDLAEPDDEPGELDDDTRRTLRSLADRQVTHLCRLFADAFATYFVGPAYVHALLSLRMRPDRTLFGPTAVMPAFIQRFVFALDTLDWMNREQRLYQGVRFKTATPFAAELDPTTGILNRWRMALAGTAKHADHTTGMPARLLAGLGVASEYGSESEQVYKLFKGIYEPWLRRVQEALNDPAWWDRQAGPATYQNWQEALKLKGEMLTPGMVVEQRPDPWAVLNAAWSALVEHGESNRKVIQENATRLLDRENNEVVKGRAQPRAGAPEDGAQRAEREQQRTRDIETVLTALGGNTILLVRFKRSSQGGRPNDIDPEILEHLQGNEEAEAAYKRLYGLG